MASDNALKELNDQISEIRKELNTQSKEVIKIKKQNMFDNFKFYLIAFVCLFFVYIIVDNTVRTIQRYMKNRKREKEEELKRRAPDENEYEPEYSIDANIGKKYRSNLRRAGENQNKELHPAKLEKQAGSKIYKTDRQIRETPLEANIDLKTLDANHDEYEYYDSKDKNSKSYWDMLFSSKDI